MTDAIVVGAGPNGLAAAITLAEAGLSVRLIEAADTIGGGTRTAELTLPGYHHDICSAVHPLGVSSPFFESLRLEDDGLEWIYPPIEVAHPLDGGDAVLVHRSLQDTSAGLGPDADSYQRLIGPLAATWPTIAPHLLGPLVRFPRHPISMIRFGLPALGSAQGLARRRFDGPRAQALFAGMAAHSILPLDHPMSASFGLLLSATAHTVGWPLPRGGSQQIADAMAARARRLGVEVETGHEVRHLDELPPASLKLFDVSPRQLGAIVGDALPPRYRRRITRFRHGPGIFKIDYALSGPVPWAAEGVDQAGTVHLGGTLGEIAAAERTVADGGHPEQPFLLVTQPSLFDETRAPAGRHTLWVYCHVPNGSTIDMTERIERQMERFAPDFTDLVLARSIMGPAAMEAHNPNYLGGDIAGGSHGRLQLIRRPRLFNPYRTPIKGIYLCSASTPPGAGVHGMCGYHAARAALQDGR